MLIKEWHCFHECPSEDELRAELDRERAKLAEQSSGDAD